MSIVRADLKWFKSQTVNDTSSNGGRMSANEVVTGVLSNLFPPIEDAERVLGSTKYRKIFSKIHQDGSDTGYSLQVYLELATDGEDAFSFFEATQTDTQSTISGSEQRYGVGDLDVNVDSGATEIDVEVESGNTGIFEVGGTFRITDKTSLDDEGGNTEFRGIDTVDVDANIVTLTFTTPLDNGYLASNTRVMSVYEPGNVVGTIEDFLVTSAGSGDYDDAEITLNNRGTVEDTWTLTFTSSTNFNVVGANSGIVGTGTVGGGAAPNNPDWTKPYFTLGAAGFSGTWTSGDTIVFKTHPACVALWVKRVVPADAEVAGANSATLRTRCQAT